MSGKSSDVRVIRVFVSSPRDVMPERERIDLVVRRLNQVFDRRVRIETVRWEKKIFTAHAGFQEQIPEAASCDVVVAVFGGRIGNPLPDGFKRMEGGDRYPSGTAYEVLSALEARRKGAGPDVFVFRLRDPSVLPDFDAAQNKDLDAFFWRWFKTPDGQFLRARHLFDDTDEFEKLVEKLLRDWIDEHVPRDRSRIWPIETKGSPFRALEPFDAKHASIFFGRNRKVARAIELLQSFQTPERRTRIGPRPIPFLLIVGESGAGKSSLMRAGVAPRLTAPGLTPEVDVWRMALARIGDDANPFLTLANALLTANDEARGFGAALPELAEDGVGDAAKLATLLEQSPPDGGKPLRSPAVAPILKALRHVQREARRRAHSRRGWRANLLLLVDQLESIFGVDEARAARFARLLHALCATRRVWIVATMRSDYYPRIIAPGDFVALKDRGATYDLAVPGEAELAEILDMSAKAAGLVYETDPSTGERLDERIFRDAQGKNTLPLLQFALQRLFERSKYVVVGDGEGKPALTDNETRLTFADYQEMGGLNGAINQAAEEAVKGLPNEDLEAEKGALSKMLRGLAVREAAPGKGRALTIRTAPWSEVAPDAAAARLIEALTRARIVVLSAAEEAGPGEEFRFVSLAHQRVLESWTRARDIVAKNIDYFRISDDVQGQYERWRSGGRKDEFLLQKGVPLAEGRSIMEKYADELKPHLRSYVELSIAAARRRTQRLVAALGAGTAVFAVLSVVAGLFYLNADRAQARATTNYEAATGALRDLVFQVVGQLRDTRGVPIDTVQKVLAITENSIHKMQSQFKDSDEIDLIRAEMLYQDGNALEKQNKLREAYAKARESTEIRARLSHFFELPSKPELFASMPGQMRVELSRSLALMGDIERINIEKRLNEDFPAPQAHFRQALDISKKVVLEAPQNDDWALDLSKNYTRLADIEADRSAAMLNYFEALRNAATYFSHDRSNELWLRELSWMFKKIGEARKNEALSKVASEAAAREEAYKAARENFSDSLCLRRRLSAQAPGKTELSRDVGYSLELLADANEGLGDAADAEGALFEALIIRRRLAESVADNALYLSDVAQTLRHVGDFEMRRSNFKNAFVAHSAAAEIFEQLAERARKDIRTQASAQADIQKAHQGQDEARQRLAERHEQITDADVMTLRKSLKERELSFERRLAVAPQDQGTCWNGMLADMDRLLNLAPAGL